MFRCVQTVQAYVDQDPDQAATIGVEAGGYINIAGATLRPLALGAKFDRLIVRPTDPNHLTIRDYKTGLPGQIDLDGACLMLAVAKNRFKEYSGFSVEFDFLNEDGLQERKTLGLEEAKVVWPDLKERALRVYNATDFPAEPGEHCAFCPFRAECQPAPNVDLDALDSLFA